MMFRKKKKKREEKEKEHVLSSGHASRLLRQRQISVWELSQIAKRTGIRIHVDDDSNVNTYTRNDVATRFPSVHICATTRSRARARARYAPC